jgi:hypothetical protein
MKTYWKLSENAWEYSGYISITSNEQPTVKPMENGEYIMSVDGVVIYFDEEIVQDHPKEKGGEGE